MANQSPSISNSATATSSANSEQQQQQPIAGSSSSVDATAPPTATATVDSSQQQQQHQQPGGPGTSLGQQQHQPQQQYPPQLGQQQRWPPEAAPPGSSPAPTPQSQAAPGGMMLASSHYAQQQYAHQHHLGVPSPSLYANTGGYPGAPPIGQHSPNSRLPYPPPQMMHPAMMGYPPPHGYGPPTGPSPYGHPAALQHYWATRGPAPPNGPGMMGPPPPQSQQYEMPSTSRHTPQPQQQSQQQQHAQQQNQHQQMPAPSPSANNAASNEESTEENAAGLRPRSSQSQHQQQQQQQQQHYQHFAQQIPPQHQMAPPQMRYMPTMMPPPHGQQFQPPPMGHPGMGPAQMHHHMPPPTMHHPAAGPFPGHPGMYFPPPPHHPAAAAPIQQQQPQQQQPQVGILPGLKPSQREAVDKLVMQMANPKQQQTPDMIYQRRLFYERLVLLNEQQGEILTGPPQVSKSTVDLYALYHSVKQKGGFEKTIRDKIWKNLCPEANCDMQSSSAAGFQLRKHYQKFLLKLECLENNLNANDLIEFAEKQKKKKKEKEKGEPPAAGSAAAGPQTPSSSSSAPTNKDHPEQKQNEKQKTAAPATAAEQQQSQQRPMPPPPPSANGPSPPQFAAYPQGMALPPGSAYPPPPAGTEFAPAPPTSGYAIPPQFGQYPPQAHSQWAAAAAYQQQQQMAAAAAGSAGMYSSPQRPPQPLPPQMRPMQQPYPTGQQQAEDDQQHQQQRLASSSSRLSSTSTPVPAEQQHPSRSSSVAGGAQSTEKQEQSQAREDDQKEATAQQQRLQANTPSSSFSANAPTPPLTRSSNVFSTSMTSASGVPGTQQPPNSSTTMTNQQQQMPPSAAGYYHPAAVYGRYPQPTQAGAVQPGDVYGPAPPAAIYHPATAPGQQPLWGSPYGMPPQQAARHFPPGTPVSRYPYATQPQPAPPTTAAASNSPQLQVAPQTPQQQQSASGSKSASKSSASFPPYATPTRGGGGHSAAGGPPAGMVPAVPVPVPNVYSVPPPQQPPQPQQYPAWFGTATLSTLPPFPSQSLEAQTISQLQQQQQLLQQQRYRRPKIYARDLVGASPARIVMALRSGLHLETNWALNALNIQLHDDTTPNAQPSLVQTPELLNLLVDHFTVLLTLLYPKEFNEISLRLQSSHRPSASSPTPSKHCKLTKSDSQSTTAAFLVPKREWTKSPSLLDDRKSEQISLMVRPPAQASSSSAAGTTQSNSTKRQQNFTMVSRLGRHVKLDSTAEMPDDLAAEMERWAMGKQKENDEEEEEEEHSQNNAETFPDFMQRIRRQIVDHIQERRALKKLVSFKCNSQKTKDEEEEHTSHRDELFLEDDEDKEKEVKERAKKQQQETLLENEQENGPRLFYRQAKPWEHWDRHCMDQSALVNRFTVLQNRHADELLGEMMNRSLAISNILRGFSFLPGQERPLAQHMALLRLLPALLMLMVDETSRKGAVGAADGQPKQFTFPRPPPEEEEAEKQMPNVKREEGEQTATTTAKMASSSAQQRQMVPAEVDSPKKWLLEVANQLRDDAFTILAHISPNLDLFDMDSSISWPIFDSLLHWTVSTDLQARDPLPPFGLIPPRHYALEILCKMSVLERNVDLLVSTGPWPRLEEFIRQLCSLICEEPPVREFAIVILNAICAACEPACFIATEQTNLLELLVAFLEAADANMTQIAQHQGIHTLRENPEIIGTSVGMLRRAALIMTQIVRHDRCRQHFHRLQHRLLQFTVSHFMDSRVAAMVADILFQMQRANGLGGRTSTRREANANENEQSSSQQHHQSQQQEPTQHMMESRKFSSTAVLQPPAPVEPELVFNGGPNAAAAAKAELGENIVENGDIQAETMPDDLANNHVPPNHGQNHQQQMAKSKGTKGGNNGNGRKRPRKSETPDSASTTSSSSSKTENIHNNSNNSNHIQQQQQPMAYEHGNWNGHSHGGHYSEGGVAHTKIELLDPTEKKAKLVGESVRERMRNNILQKKNGWIETAPILTTVGTTEMPLQNGTAEMHQNNNNNNDVKMEAHEEEEVDHDESHRQQLLEQTSVVCQQNSEPSKLEMQPIASPTPNNTTGTTTPTTSGTNNNNNNVQTAAASSGSLTAVA